MRVEADEEGDDQRQDHLEQEVQRDQADRQRVAELAEQELARPLVEVARLARQVDPEAEQDDRLALYALDRVLRLGEDARRLLLELADLRRKQGDEDRGDPDQAGHQGDEDDDDRQGAGQVGGEAVDEGIDQEGEEGAEDEGAEGVADQVDDADADDHGGDPDPDLERPDAAPAD